MRRLLLVLALLGFSSVVRGAELKPNAIGNQHNSPNLMALALLAQVRKSHIGHSIAMIISAGSVLVEATYIGTPLKESLDLI